MNLFVSICLPIKYQIFNNRNNFQMDDPIVELIVDQNQVPLTSSNVVLPIM